MLYTILNSYATPTSSIYVGDVTVDGTLSESASAWNSRHTGTIVSIARCTTCKCRPTPAPAVLFHSKFRRQGATSLNHRSRISLAASLIIARMR